MNTEDLLKYAAEISEPAHFESHRIIKLLLTEIEVISKERKNWFNAAQYNIKASAENYQLLQEAYQELEILKHGV